MIGLIEDNWIYKDNLLVIDYYCFNRVNKNMLCNNFCINGATY